MGFLYGRKHRLLPEACRPGMGCSRLHYHLWQGFRRLHPSVLFLLRHCSGGSCLPACSAVRLRSVHARCIFETTFHGWQFIVTEVVAGESLQACLCPFIETFKHGNGEGILHVPVLGLVVDGVAGQPACIVIFFQIIVGRGLISFVNTAIVVKLYRMDEARYRNIFALVEKRVFGIFLLDGQQTVGSSFSVYCDSGTVVPDVLCV